MSGESVRQRPVWRPTEDLPRAVAGVGPIVSRTLLGQLPDLGRLNRTRIAALDVAFNLTENHDRGEQTVE